MKLNYIFCVALFVIGVSAQRRSSRVETSSAEPQTHRSITSRGRAKFTSSPEFAQIADTSETASDVSSSQSSRPSSRRRLDYERHLEPRQRSQDVTQKPAKIHGSYEVQEIVDDIPRENAKRPLLRPRAQDQQTTTLTPPQAKPEKTEVPIVQTTNLEGSTEEQKLTEQVPSNEDVTGAVLFEQISEQTIPLTTKLFTPTSNEQTSTEDLMKEIPKIQKITPVAVAPVAEEPRSRFLTRSKAKAPSEPAPVFEEPQRFLPRAQLRSRTNSRVDEVTTSSRGLTRTRGHTKSDDTTSTTARTIQRTRAPKRVETTSQETVKPLRRSEAASQEILKTRRVDNLHVKPARNPEPTPQVATKPAYRKEIISHEAARLETNFRNPESTVVQSNFRTRGSSFKKRPSEPVSEAGTRKEAIQQRVSRLEQEFKPSLLADSDYQTRSRTSRKIDHRQISRRSDTSEEIEEVLDGRQFRKAEIQTSQSRRRETIVAAENQSVENSKETNKYASRRPSKTITRGRSSAEVKDPTTAKPIARNSRLRTQPHFDETKLEVLPLFESDTKTEKSTAVDSVPEFSKIIPPESTTPLTSRSSTEGSSTVHSRSASRSTTTTPEVSSSRNTPSRRVPSRTPIREVKNNKIEESHNSRSSRRHPASTTTTTTTAPSSRRDHIRTSRGRDVKQPTQEKVTAAPRGRGRHHQESSTSEATVRRKQEPRTRAKKVEQNVPETRLQNLSPRRSNRPHRVESTTSTTTSTTTTTTRPTTASTTTTSTTTTTTTEASKVSSSARHSNRANSRFNRMEDELQIEELAESNVSKKVRKPEEVNTKQSRNTKRGTTKNHSELTSSEEAIDDNDNYPEPFKALIQAKIKQKEEDNELNPLNSISTPKPSPRHPVERVSTHSESKTIEVHPKSSTIAPSTSTTKEVLTSVSQKITRQRFHARFKSDSKGNSKSKNSTSSYRPANARNSKNLSTSTTTKSPVVKSTNSRNVNANSPVVKSSNSSASNLNIVNRSYRNKSRNLPAPKAATGIYSSKKSARSTTPVPKVESTTMKRGGTFVRNNIGWEQAVSTSETPQAAKPKAHRFSAKYRSDLLRATGFKASSTPVYVPTVPTVTPYVSTSTSSGVITEENELGMEIISLDEPVKLSIPSANLIRDDYLQSTPDDKSSTNLDSTSSPVDVKLTTKRLEALSQTKTIVSTTEQVSKKPITILESIINAITSTPIVSTTNSPLRSSTIFFSSTSKPSTQSSVNLLTETVQKRTIDSETNNQITTEKAVSIFEQIIKSLTQNAVSSTTPKATTTTSTTTSTTSTTTTTTKPTTTSQKPTTTAQQKSTIQRIPPKRGDISFGTPRSVIENILNSLSSIRNIVETTTSMTPSERVVIITRPTQKVVKLSSNITSTTIASATKSTSSTEKLGQRSITILSTPPNTLTTPSTTLDPINGFLNEISSENSLQKRTLSELISLLNIANTGENKTNSFVAKSANLVAAPTTTVVPTTTTTTNIPTTNVQSTMAIMSTTSVPTTTPNTKSEALMATTETAVTEIPNSSTTNAPTTINTSPTTTTTTMPTTTTGAPTTTTTENIMQMITTQEAVTIMPETSSSNRTNEALMVTEGRPVDGTTVENTVTPDISTISTPTSSPTSISSVIAPNSFSVDINSVSVSSASDVSLADILAIINAGGTSTEAILNTDSSLSGDFVSENSISDLPYEIISTTKQNGFSTTLSQLFESTSVNNDVTTVNTESSSTMGLDMSTITMPVDTTPFDISSNTIESSAAKIVTQTNDTKSNTENNSTTVETNKNSQGNTNNNQILSPNLSSRFNSPQMTSVSPLISTVSPNRDYYLFAILPNNTVVRKKPSMYPTKETPYLIVGIYPNNTIIRKFPNGTLVPEEPVIQVRGFDTRENPPDITSNQVTPDRSPATDDNTLTTENDTSKNPEPTSSSAIPGIPKDVELLNGNTFANFNNVVEKSTAGSVVYKTLDIDPLTNQVRTTRPGELTTIGNTVFRWKPVTSTAIPEISNKINVDTNVVGSASSTTPSVLNSISSSTMKIMPPAQKVMVSSSTQKNVPSSTTQRATSTAVSVMEQMRQNLRAAIQVSPTTPAPTTTGAPTTRIFTTMAPAPFTTAAPTTTTQAPTTTTRPPTTTTRMPTTTTQIPTTTTRPPTTTTPAPTTTTRAPTTTTRAPTTTTRPPTTTTRAPTTTTRPPTTTTRAPTTTRPPTTTKAPTTRPLTTRIPTTTFRTIPTTRATTTTFRTTTTTISPTTIRIATTSAPVITTIRRGSRRRPTTVRITTETPTTTTTTTTTTVRTRLLARLQSIATTENDRMTVTPETEIVTITPEPTIQIPSSTIKTVSSTLKTLTEEQKKNLETLAQLENEQAAILKQLSFLTNLIPGAGRLMTRASTTSKPLVETTAKATSINSILSSIRTADTTSKKPTTLSLLDSMSSSISAQTVKSDSQKQLEDLLKQYNLEGVKYQTTTAAPVTLPYGKSNDAILAALLKEQGITPNTPRLELFNQLQQKTTKPTTTTPRPGMIMQGLNWLLNRLAPLQQNRATQKPRVSISLPEVNTEEIMTRQPTKLTPVIYDGSDEASNSIPSSTIRPRALNNNDLDQQEQREIAFLLKQIQAIQKDPEAAQDIVKQFTGKPSATYNPRRRGNLSPQELVVLLKEVQALQNDPKTVKNIKAAIQSETTRSYVTPTTTRTTTTTTTTRPTTRRSQKTLNDLSQQELGLLLKQIQTVQQQNPGKVQNLDLSTLLANAGNEPSLSQEDLGQFTASRKPIRQETLDVYDSPTTRKPALPPVQFRPVNGIPEGDSQFRGRLVNAAVSVTRAISSFLGSAISGATSAISSLVRNSSAGSSQ